ncbi:type 1 glutamine amidotransferase domain-containing protein [Mucilaginibacter myungsuensis]|uniref:Type 1 glutamine amidotransferase domain-containing protein n=1 Tax=Mucilaginibacter myungsuensis TaxID=649104 RepID=A0A929PYF3_9SPHI|nr:type 1 glutamine amidotransferase domain-containing protein [Mucilaginibacter myungsuensis]MBE9664114.1 type 1 glutamine amidotransferase domain-containing protein [Mucilaginibacter myungsuensis]MDN3601293.1 type 1 glutamine amidotransferase domain-containing protein [Mucilaginibacter myungsuensis]
MKKNILFVVSSASVIGPNNRATGNLLTEVAHPYQTFKAQGYNIDVFSVAGGDAPIDMVELEDQMNQAFLNGEGAIAFKNTQSIDKIDVTKYDAVFVPGGLAPVVDMPDDPIVQKILADMYDQGGVVSAVCHGPVALINVKLSDGSYLINGKHVTGFSKAEEEHYAKVDVPFELEDALIDRGGKYSAAAEWQAHIVTDGRLVTGQNPASATGVAESVINLLEPVQA